VTVGTERRPVATARGRDLGDEYLFYDRDRDLVHVLNETAREVFLVCDGEHTEEQIAAILVERFDVDGENALADTHATVRRLIDLGLVAYEQGEE